MTTRRLRSALVTDRINYYQERHDNFVSPLDFLLLTMNGLDTEGNTDEDIPLHSKIDCAKTTIRHQVPTLAAVEHEVVDEPQSREDMLRELAEILKGGEMENIMGDKWEEEQTQDS